MKKIILNFWAILALCATPYFNYAQAPNLGRVATFALFTSAGAFSNTGASNVTGDIGTQVGALTGFPPGTLTGSIHIADSVTTLAATNLGTAYGELSAATCDSTIGATMGSGQLLTPKVYCVTTLATLTGNLTLDGQGDTNALFIFKINGAFSTATFTTITLINGALLQNVYWQINGAFVLGDNSVFKGSVLANGAITLLANATLVGRGLTTAGAISLNTNTSALPVKLQSFRSSCVGSRVLLNWSTASESNNSYFVVETSTDKLHWKRIAKIAGSGNSTVVKQYSFTHPNAINGISYYRLQQTDYDGQSTYSDIIATAHCKEMVQTIQLFPNPASGSVSIKYEGNRKAVQSISIFNFLGTRSYYADGFPAVIDLSDKPNGIYFVQFQLEQKIVTQKLVIKNE
jgi:hypothetical protein